MEHKNEVSSLVVTLARKSSDPRYRILGSRIALADQSMDRGWIVRIYTTEGERVNQVNGYSWSSSFSPDGKKLVCGTEDDICVYVVKTGTLILGSLKGHKDWVKSVLWSRHGCRLFSGSHDKTIRCWNSNMGEQIGQPWTAHTDWIDSPDGTILASASSDETFRFWDTTHGRPIRQHLQHDTSINSVCFSPSGEFAASADGGGDIYLWRVPRVSSIHHRVITPFMCSIFALILIVSQVTPAFPDARHPRFCSHTPLILRVTPSLVLA